MQTTKVVRFIKECFPIDECEDGAYGISRIEWVAQDRFHCSHNFAKFLLSSAPGYHETLIDLRQSSTVVDNRCRSSIFSAVMSGALVKRCSFKGRDFSTREILDLLSAESRLQRFLEWEESGVLHEMFSTQPCLLPEEMVDVETLNRQLDAFLSRVHSRVWDSSGGGTWHNNAPLLRIPSAPYPLILTYPLSSYPLSSLSPFSSLSPLPSLSPFSFHPVFADAGNPLHPGKLLVPSQTDLTRLGANLKARMRCCVPPTAALKKAAFIVIGKFQQMDVHRNQYHSCGNESWHSITSDFVTTDAPSKELKTGLYYEGNSARNSEVTIALGEAPRTGHRRPWASLDSNELAGHGESNLQRIVSVAPHAGLPQLKPPAEGEVIVQEVGSFAAKSSKGAMSAPQLALRSRLAAEDAHLPRVPQRAWLRLLCSSRQSSSAAQAQA